MAMRVGVLGGTGRAGSAAADALAQRGHDVRALARGASGSARIDVRSGDGLAAALEGLDVLVDALNAPWQRPRDASATMVDGLGRALRAAREAGIAHVVSLSIVGAARVPIAYYRVKVEQERVVRDCGLPWTIVRATQFHSLVALAFAASARYGMVLAPRGVVQPVDAREVGAAVADAVERPAAGETRAFAGPEIVPIRELARAYRERRARRRPVVPLPALGTAMRAIAAGALTDASAPRGDVTFAQWLDG